MRREKYEAMYDMEAHESLTHKKMPMADRAAQFSPFAALVGYDEVLSETIRQTEERRLATSDKAEEIERKLLVLEKEVKSSPLIKVTYFARDEKKEGGHYLVFEGNLIKIDPYMKTLVFSSSFRLPISDILELEGDIFLQY
ncbi:MAG: hypothetical protein K6B65_01490 [Bacilli bacterium]|nr:hypothetical protein [Bacilli bacterium]